jgi:hypothetical protein
MTKLFALAALLATTSIAAGEPQPPTPPPPPSGTAPAPHTCSPNGDPVASIIKVMFGHPQHFHVWRAALYANGAWTRETSDDGAPFRKVGGCFDDATNARITGELVQATWKTTANAAPCDAVSDSDLEFRVGGKLVWSVDVCPPATLDGVSKLAIDDLQNLLAEHSPPCCKK